MNHYRRKQSFELTKEGLGMAFKKIYEDELNRLVK
jgi:hypothetical protein